MGHDQRQRVWLGGADMKEVNTLAVDLGRVLRKLVEPGLLLARVVAGAPVLGELAQIAQRDTRSQRSPVSSSGQRVQATRPWRSRGPLGDVDPEGLDIGVRAAGLSHAAAPSSRFS